MTHRLVCFLVALACASHAAHAQTPAHPGTAPTDGVEYAETSAALRAIGFTPSAPPIKISQSLWLSPGGKSYARLKGDSSGVIMTVNDHQVGEYPGVPFKWECVWSDDGSTVVTVVPKGEDPRDPQALIINGREIATHASFRSIALSHDGKRYAYVATDEGGPEIYVDGRRMGSYFDVNEIGFSPDGSTAIWIAAEKQPLRAKDPGGYDVYVEGRKFPAHFRYAGRSPYDRGVGSVVFSADSKRWAVRGQVFGPRADAGDIGGYAVMVDGKMGPTFGDVVYGTLQFTADSKNVLYAAGTPHEDDYAVYRDGQAGQKWNYIAPGSIRPIRGGRSLAFTAYQGSPSRFTVEHPVPGSAGWSPGLPALVIDDTVALPTCARWCVSEDGKHILAEQMAIERLTGRTTSMLLLDGSKVAATPVDALAVKLSFSPDGRHWAAAIIDRFVEEPRLIVDGIERKLPPATFVQEVSIDNAGGMTMLAPIRDAIWRLSSGPRPTP